MASNAYQDTDSVADPQYHDDHSSVDSALSVILPENTSNTIITKAPEERFRLGRWDVIALVVNRMIGMCSHLSWN
jgi:hypothetical protein